jgi:hypothetical protein
MLGAEIYSSEVERTAGNRDRRGAHVRHRRDAESESRRIERAGNTLPGRIVATGWMNGSVIAFAIFAADLTKQQLQGVVQSVNDLRSVRVGATDT